MLIEITKFDPYVKNWQGLQTGVENGKTIFELTSEQTEHFLRNAAYYKVKAKKLFFDDVKDNYPASDKFNGYGGITSFVKCATNYKPLTDKFKAIVLDK